MKILKDLLYTRDNQALDIARVSALLSVLGFWGAQGWSIYTGQPFRPIETGTGIAAIFAGAAAWIYYRQRMESGQLNDTGPPRQGPRRGHKNMRTATR